MNIQDLRQLPDDRLLDELEDLKESLFNLRFQKSYGQLEDPNALRRAKRDVARILTVIRERQIAAGGENG
ncbi:MAG: 50S ribosomal protein L29 [Anaerolineae bacterium]